MNNTERKFDNFDEFAGEYRAIHTENIKISGADSDYFSEHRIIEIKNQEAAFYNPDKQSVKIMDIGCGDGNSARFFIKYFPESIVYGIDITEKVIESAILRRLKKCHFQVYDGENIPYEDNTFDIVFLANILHHVDRKYHLKLMQEALRVLKKGGCIYNFEHNPWNPVTRKLVKDCIFDKDALLLKAPYLKKLKTDAGFKEVKIRFTIFFPRFDVFKPFLPLEKWFHWLPIGGQYYARATKY